MRPPTIPPELHGPSMEGFAAWWLEQGEIGPVHGNEERFDRCRTHFIAGAARDISPIYAAGAMHVVTPELLVDAFFAGHAWRARHRENV